MRRRKRIEDIAQRISLAGAKTLTMKDKIVVTIDDGQKFIVWPYKEQWCKVINGRLGARYYGDVKWFAARCVSKAINCPENAGKKWDDDEIEFLFEMAEADCTVNFIANELGRLPLTIAYKLFDLEITNIQHDFYQYGLLLDLPVSELNRFIESYQGFETRVIEAYE